MTSNDLQRTANELQRTRKGVRGSDPPNAREACARWNVRGVSGLWKCEVLVVGTNVDVTTSKRFGEKTKRQPLFVNEKRAPRRRSGEGASASRAEQDPFVYLTMVVQLDPAAQHLGEHAPPQARHCRLLYS